MAGKAGDRAPGPASGSRKKDKKERKDDSNPRKALYGALGVAAVAVLASLLGAARLWKRSSAESEALNDAAEKLRLLNNKAALFERMQKLEAEEKRILGEKERAEKEKAQIAESMEGDGPALGPSVMAAQSKLIGRLLELAQKVEALKGEDQRQERDAVSRQVEEELAELEASSDVKADTAVGKQQAALIALVKSALRSDRNEDGPSADEDWSEEGLRKKHGLVTYASQAYWDEAYNQGSYGESFDWYGAWTEDDLNGRSLRDLVRPLVKDDARILMLGCGNSNMTRLMHGDGLRRITSVDISEKVIEQMRQRHEDLEGLEWHAMDASKMDFEAGSFDVAVEKGLFDALYAGTGERVRPVLTEVKRILKPGGRLISVSFGGDRIERLFNGADAERGEVASATSFGDCRVTGELSYRKAAQTDEGPTSKAIYVYDCQRGA